MIGYGSLRQLRVKNGLIKDYLLIIYNSFLKIIMLFLGSCQLFDSFRNSFGFCLSDLNRQNQDVSLYGFGWSQFNQNYSPPFGFQSIYNAFQYQDANKLQGSPITGQFNTYDGSGYVYELRGQLSYIQGNLSLLQEMQWIDRQTRAIFVEFSSYNPNVNLVMVSTILVEFLSSGTILTNARFDPINLFAETGGISFKIIAELIFVAFVIFFMITQIKSLAKIGIFKYMSDFWSYIEFSIISCALIAFLMFILRYIVAQEVLDFFKKTSGFGYMKLQSVNEYNQYLTYSLSLCVGFSTIKYLKMLRFNEHILNLGLTLKNCLVELASFGMIFSIILFSFVQLMYLFYGSYLDGYSSLGKSFETSFTVMLGKFDTSHYLQQNKILGPFIFSIFNIIMIFFALNIFVTIITESFDKVRKNTIANRHQELNFWAQAKFYFYNLFRKRTSEINSSINLIYRDHITIFPKRIEELSVSMIQVFFLKTFIFFKIISQMFDLSFLKSLDRSERKNYNQIDLDTSYLKSKSKIESETKKRKMYHKEITFFNPQ